VHVADLGRPSSSPRALPRRFQDRREAGWAGTSRCLPRVHPCDLDRHHPAPCGATCTAIGTPSVVSVIDRVAPAAESVSAFLFECARRLAHRSRLGAAASCVSTLVRRAPRPAPCRRFALRLLVASRRAMRQTDFCLLTFFVRAPAPRRLSMRHALARLRDRGDRLPHVSAIRFGGPHVCRGVTAVGVVVPSRCVRSGPLASLSPPPRVSRRSRDLRTRGSRLDRPRPDRVNDASRTSNPRCLPSSKDPRPATPSRAPGSGLLRVGGLATATTVLDAFEPPRVLANPRGPGPRPRAPLPTGDTLLWASASLADFCNLKRRASTPYERSILTREWGFRPATRRHQPMPVALARDTSPHRGPASLDLHPTAPRTMGSTLVDQGSSRAEASEQRRAARSWTKSRVPFSLRLGHPGRRLDR